LEPEFIQYLPLSKLVLSDLQYVRYPVLCLNVFDVVIVTNIVLDIIVVMIDDSAALEDWLAV
jgi:hypothetical protein